MNKWDDANDGCGDGHPRASVMENFRVFDNQGRLVPETPPPDESGQQTEADV